MPKVLILGLDHPWFNQASGYSKLPPKPMAVDDERTLDLTRVLSVSQQTFGDFLNRKIDVGKVLGHKDPVHGVEAVGLNAISNGMGFRNDGSYQYGSHILNFLSTDERLGEGFIALQENFDSHFVAGREVAQSSLDELEAILKYSSEQDIYVIGFSPPYAPSIYAKMMADGKHEYIPKMVSRLAALFERYGFSYFDFSAATALGATDDDMIDAFHASEFIYLRMYLHMLLGETTVW